jgi:hypothetical protein
VTAAPDDVRFDAIDPADPEARAAVDAYLD